MITRAQAASSVPHPKRNGSRGCCADWRTSGTNYWDVYLSRVNEKHVAPEMHKHMRFSPDPSAQVGVSSSS